MKRTLRDIVAHQEILSGAASMSVREACMRMAEHRVGAILILERGQLIGIFTERDALARVLARRLDPDQTPVADVMTRDPHTVVPEKPLAHALMMMHEGGYRHVPVVENGKPLGMVSARDALGAELVELEDELDRRDRLTEIMI